MYSYITKGVCSKQIFFDIKDGRVYNVSFEGGCSGNLKGICNLIDGMSVEEVIKKLEGTLCGNKSTSCPDQLSKALKEHLK